MFWLKSDELIIIVLILKITDEMIILCTIIRISESVVETSGQWKTN